ncbi:MAG: guanylate kinase [Phycisphaeraceae bacterium]|nr:MAG: guanylate kinase [Phycisphaeraceae bacterium]
MTTPPDRRRLETDTDDGLVLIISGPSGVGKTTLTRGVERTIPDAVFSVSYTTRPRTDADIEGVDYHFVDDAAFEAMRSRGEFLESAGVYGKKYGTPRAWVLEQLARGRLVILEIDVQGAIEVRRQLPEALAVFILPPGEDILLQRLRDRKREAEEVIQRRFGQARSEIRAARESGVYHQFIVNERLDEAVAGVVEAVRRERERRREDRRPRAGAG